MIVSTQILDWRKWRWRSVISAMTQPDRSLTLRELLETLEAFRNRAIDQPLHLKRLIALVQGDLERLSAYPGRRDGPNVRRSVGAWRARYNDIDRYLRAEPTPSGNALQDADIAARLSAAENEGWPLANSQHRRVLFASSNS